MVRPYGRDSGSVSIEAVIALPVLMLTVAAGMQVALLFFARAVALSAAQEGVRAARSWHASHAAAAPVAEQYAQRTGGGFLRSVTATASSGVGTIRVHVRGKALSMVPFLNSIAVDVQAAGPVERWTVPSRGLAISAAQNPRNRSTGANGPGSPSPVGTAADISGRPSFDFTA